MPKSKLKKTARKENKLRPYRVDYFLHDEMLKDKALVRSTVIRAVTAQEAQNHLAALGVGGSPFTIIRTYRFYKTLTAQPIKKTYIAIDKLLTAKKAVEVMTEIENRKVPIVIRPEDLGITTTIPETVTTEVIDPTKLPSDHPDHVCTDACWGIAELKPKFGDPAPATVFVPEWAPDADTSNVAAGYLFPNKPLIPTKDAVFDGVDLTPCRWHDGKYLDLQTGRCTATDSGSEYLRDLYEPQGPVRTVNLDEAAPVLYQAPAEAAYTVEHADGLTETSSGAAENWTETEEKDASEYTPEAGQGLDYVEVQSERGPGFRILIGAVVVIGAIVYAYFRWFAK